MTAPRTKIPKDVSREHRVFLARRSLIQAAAGAVASLVMLAVTAAQYRRVTA